MHVITSTTARDAWGGLAQFYHTQDMASRLWLKERFSSFKYTATTMSAHVTELERLVLDMTIVGVCLARAMCVCYATEKSTVSIRESDSIFSPKRDAVYL